MLGHATFLSLTSCLCEGAGRVTGRCDETQTPSKTQGRSGTEGGSIQPVLQGLRSYVVPSRVTRVAF